MSDKKIDAWQLELPERPSETAPEPEARAYALRLEELADEAEHELATRPVRAGSRQADINREHGRRMPWHGMAGRPLAPAPSAGKAEVWKHIRSLEIYLGAICLEIASRPLRRKNMGPLPEALARTSEVRSYAEWNRWRAPRQAPRVTEAELMGGV